MKYSFQIISGGDPLATAPSITNNRTATFTVIVGEGLKDF
jgi:hypothetical protein